MEEGGVNEEKKEMKQNIQINKKRVKDIDIHPMEVISSNELESALSDNELFDLINVREYTEDGSSLKGEPSNKKRKARSSPPTGRWSCNYCHSKTNTLSSLVCANCNKGMFYYTYFHKQLSIILINLFNININLAWDSSMKEDDGNESKFERKGESKRDLNIINAHNIIDDNNNVKASVSCYMEEETEEEKEEDRLIEINVRDSTGVSNRITTGFKIIKTDTPLRALLNAYERALLNAHEQNEIVKSVRNENKVFVWYFKDTKLKLHDNPRTLNLQNNDFLDCMLEDAAVPLQEEGIY